MLDREQLENWTQEELEDRVSRNWMSWQMEESKERGYDPKMTQFYKQRYYYYKKMLDELTGSMYN